MKTNSGFTLVELVSTLVLIGILAAVVVPRFANRADFDVFGFTSQTRQALQFAQKSAIAKRRLVCVSLSGGTLSLQLASVFGASACDTPLIGPDGKAFSQTAPSGVAISDAPFNFDALGRPSAAQTLVVSGGSVSQTITVEAETGYVH